MKKKPIYTSVQTLTLSGKPIRNYLCPYYEECMDRAAMDNVILHCKECPYRETEIEEFILSTPEIKACARLVSAVFGEDHGHRGRVI